MNYAAKTSTNSGNSPTDPTDRRYRLAYCIDARIKEEADALRDRITQLCDQLTAKGFEDATDRAGRKLGWDGASDPEWMAGAMRAYWVHRGEQHALWIAASVILSLLDDAEIHEDRFGAGIWR